MPVRTMYTIALILLLINALSAIFGGVSLILDPTGELLGMSVNRLRFLPLSDYLIPGILLLLFNGISSLAIVLLINRKVKNTSILIMLQGVVLIVWIMVQALAIPYDRLQIIYGTIGILLTVLGILLSRSAKSSSFYNRQ